jgi:hypothetical protein
VREHLPGQFVRQVVEELGEGRQRSGPRLGGLVGQDVVRGGSDVEDPRRGLVGDLHAVGVLQLLDERVEIERVRFEVLLEAGPLDDARGLDLELVGQMVRIRSRMSSRFMRKTRR